jgi:hypothetical protein
MKSIALSPFFGLIGVDSAGRSPGLIKRRIYHTSFWADFLWVSP